MRRPTPGADAIQGAVASAKTVKPVAFAIDLEGKTRLALTCDEVADLLGWKAQWVRDAIGRGEIRSNYTGRRHAIPVGALLEFLGVAA